MENLNREGEDTPELSRWQINPQCNGVYTRVVVLVVKEGYCKKKKKKYRRVVK